MNGSNLERLTTAARILQPLLGELVFVGGAVTGLLVSDAAAGDSRTTFDVDVIAAITSYAEYAAFGERLRELGFFEDTREGAPLCRWVHDGTTLDLMPLDRQILGFSNRWYRAAIKSAAKVELPDDLEIRIVTAPFFVATKLEAFNGRGAGDLFGSRDLEDFLTVVDGRVELIAEMQAETAELQAYVRAEVQALLRAPRFIDALPGHLLPDAASQSRIGIVLQRLNQLASI